MVHSSLSQPFACSFIFACDKLPSLLDITFDCMAWLGLVEAGIKVSDNVDLNKQLPLDKNYENACCLGGEFEREEELVIARLQCLIASSYH